ncbi:MAG TPA: hypothetical protein VMI56_26025 [Reyranella sp.]|nr:hypothetical protein [Reyranella sp.]
MRLSVALWAVFLALVVITGIVLLRACALVMPVAGWNFCPGVPAALADDRKHGDDLIRQLTRLEGELAKQRLACAAIPPPAPPPLDLPKEAGPPRPQQTAELKPPPPPPAPPAPLPADRWAKKDLSLLEGCWTLGHETQSLMGGAGRSETCTVKAGRICFDKNGQGQREMDEICPTYGNIQCRAQITASFGGEGSLHTTQPATPCRPTSTWLAEPNFLTCRRQSDTLAVCKDGKGFDYEFRR